MGVRLISSNSPGRTWCVEPVSRAAAKSARSGTTHAAGLVSNNGPASMRGIIEVPALLLPLVNFELPDAKGTHHARTDAWMRPLVAYESTPVAAQARPLFKLLSSTR